MLRELKCIDSDKEEKFNRRVLLALNTVFYSLILGGILSAWLDKKDAYAWTAIDFICKVAPAIVLFVTIILLRRLVSRLGRGLLMGRDKLMNTHAIIFLVYIIGNCGYKLDTILLTQDFKNYDPDGGAPTKCRYFVSFIAMGAVC